MSKQLPGVGIIFFIAFGAMTFILLFIFAKRQITRFTLKSRRGLHAPIAAGAPKHISREIDRRLGVIENLRCRPRLLPSSSFTPSSSSSNLHKSRASHWYRMKALDSLVLLEQELHCPQLCGLDLRAHLLKLISSGPLAHCEPGLVLRFASLYEWARHGPADFTADHYKEFMDLLHVLLRSIAGKPLLEASSKVSSSMGPLHQCMTDPGPYYEGDEPIPMIQRPVYGSLPPQVVLETSV